MQKGFQSMSLERQGERISIGLMAHHLIVCGVDLDDRDAVERSIRDQFPHRLSRIDDAIAAARAQTVA